VYLRHEPDQTPGMRVVKMTIGGEPCRKRGYSISKDAHTLAEMSRFPAT
jgi:hypothetical protein